jgi:hypothetical protein
MVEAGTWSLQVKVHPGKKTAIEKNSTVSDMEFDSLSLTVEFFDLRIDHRSVTSHLSVY